LYPTWYTVLTWPLAKRTFTLPSTNLTLNVLPLIVLP